MLRAHNTEAPEQFACQQLQCQQQQPPPLDTISHALLSCPTAAAVWRWFAEQVWQKVQPREAQPDVSSMQLILLDDSSVWAPPQQKALLWTHLRLLMLETLWHARCSTNSSPPTAQATACAFKAKLQRQIRQDWQRVRADIRIGAGVPAAWLTGRDPQLSQRSFEAKWGALVTYVQGSPMAYLSTASLAAAS
jgi:hypothetical protein